MEAEALYTCHPPFYHEKCGIFRYLTNFLNQEIVVKLQRKLSEIS